MAIFHKERIRPQAFVAPSHTFDENTIKALKSVTDIKVISDGMSYLPVDHDGMILFPQQEWRLEPHLFGTWTFCYHPNTLPDDQFPYVEWFCKKYKHRFIDSLMEMPTKYKGRKADYFDMKKHKQFFDNHRPPS